VPFAGKQQNHVGCCHNVITVKIRTASLVELHAFLGVCNTGTMRQAAEQLCVSQAAVSRAIARLERRIGCSLFERSAQGVVPNAAARALHARIEPSLVELERAFTEFGEARAQRSTLRLSVVPTLGTRWLMPRLGAFQAAHPDIGVELRQFRHNEDFRRDDVDVWIDLKRPGRPWPRGISARYLLGREITPVCTPGIAARLKAPADLLDEALLHHTNYPDNWRLWLGAAQVNNTRLKLAGGFDLANNLIVAATAGMGVAVLQPCLIERELASGELVLPFELRVSTGRGYFFCTRKAADDKKSVEAFRRWMGDMVRT
jgi:LysR family transcriptional regulator, glycine cleavage system transcriptional activator